MRIQRIGVSLKHIPGGVLLQRRPNGRPGADIGPAGIERNDACAFGPFHHRIIDRIAGTVGEYAGVHAVEIDVIRALFERLTADS